MLRRAVGPAWRLLRESLEYQGVSVEFASLHEVIRRASTAHLVSDEEVWTSMLEDCDRLALAEDESSFAAVVMQTRDRYLSALKTLRIALAGQLAERLAPAA